VRPRRCSRWSSLSTGCGRRRRPSCRGADGRRESPARSWRPSIRPAPSRSAASPRRRRRTSYELWSIAPNEAPKSLGVVGR
jgi:hypothetical protein